VEGLADAVGERFDTPVEIINPFQSVQYNVKDFDAAYLDDVGPACAIAVGLAVRKVGDK
jgi:type IV pilus assembly protein PilM